MCPGRLNACYHSQAGDRGPGIPTAACYREVTATQLSSDTVVELRRGKMISTSQVC